MTELDPEELRRIRKGLASRGTDYEAITRRGKEIVPYLLAILNHKSAKVYTLAVRPFLELAETIQLPEAVQPLANLAQSEEVARAIAAFTILRRMGECAQEAVAACILTNSICTHEFAQSSNTNALFAMNRTDSQLIQFIYLRKDDELVQQGRERLEETMVSITRMCATYCPNKIDDILENLIGRYRAVRRHEKTKNKIETGRKYQFDAQEMYAQVTHLFNQLRKASGRELTRRQVRAFVSELMPLFFQEDFTAVFVYLPLDVKKHKLFALLLESPEKFLERIFAKGDLWEKVKVVIEMARFNPERALEMAKKVEAIAAAVPKSDDYDPVRFHLIGRYRRACEQATEDLGKREILELERAGEIGKIIALGERAVVPLVLLLMEEEEQSRRDVVCNYLKGIAEKTDLHEALRPIFARVGSENRDDREHATAALNALVEQGIWKIDRLIEDLKSSDEKTAEIAAQLIASVFSKGRFGDREKYIRQNWLGGLVEAINSPNENARYHTINAIRYMIEARVPGFESFELEDSREAFSALVAKVFDANDKNISDHTRRALEKSTRGSMLLWSINRHIRAPEILPLKEARAAINWVWGELKAHATEAHLKVAKTNLAGYYDSCVKDANGKKEILGLGVGFGELPKPLGRGVFRARRVFV